MNQIFVFPKFVRFYQKCSKREKQSNIEYEPVHRTVRGKSCLSCNIH